MKTAEDFKRSIGPADPEFEAAMRRALTALESGKERKMKKKFTWFAAVVLALLLTGSVCAAAGELRLGDLFTNAFPIASCRLKCELSNLRETIPFKPTVIDAETDRFPINCKIAFRMDQNSPEQFRVFFVKDQSHC